MDSTELKTGSIDLNLETSLMFSGDANDIGSLKALARSESNKANELKALLIAVLDAAGPQRIDQRVLAEISRGNHHADSKITSRVSRSIELIQDTDSYLIIRSSN